MPLATKLATKSALKFPGLPPSEADHRMERVAR